MKDGLIKNLEVAHGKTPVFYALCGVCFWIAFLICSNGCAYLESSEGGSHKHGESGDEAKQLVLRKKTIRDKRLNMNSHMIYVPDGWKLDGEAKWISPSYAKAQPSPEITITSRNNVRAHVFSSVLFVDPKPTQFGVQRPQRWTSYDGMPVFQLPESNSAWRNQFQNELFKLRHPNAKNIRVNDVKEEAELTQGLEKQFAPLIAQIKQRKAEARSYGLTLQQEIDIKGLIIESTFTENGVEKEAIGVLGLFSISTPFAGHVQTIWSTTPNLSFVAPKGQLEPHLPKLMAILSTARPLPRWNQQVQKIFTPRRQPVTGNSATANIGKSYSDILDISHNGFRKRQNMIDAGQSRYVNSVHQVTPYTHNGTQYQLPSGYDHVYTNDYDTIILTNDALLQPNVDFGGSHQWSKMNGGN